MESTEPSHWCHSCNSFVIVQEGSSVLCQDCGGGFVEEMTPHHRRHHRHHHRHRHHNHHHHHSPVSTETLLPESHQTQSQNMGNATTFQPLFYPFIVLRRTEETGTYELLYDDGSGLGLRPLVPGMSEIIMGQGFDRILEHFIHFDTITVTHPPATKAAIDSLPTIRINLGHIISDSHCAVCTEPFEANAVASELPCKHFYHSDCILPWLKIRNSCPVCRHELKPDVAEMDGLAVENGEESMGLIIWRLPRGGYAIGRFNGNRGVNENEESGDYNEMDDEVDVSGGSSSRVIRTRSEIRRGRISHAFRNILSFFGRSRSSSLSQLNMEVSFSEEMSRGDSRRRAVVDA